MHRAIQALLLATMVPATIVFSCSAAAGNPADQQRRFEDELRVANSPYRGFSAQRGEAFFKSTHGGEWSCSSCHTSNPLAAGKHAKTGKAMLGRGTEIWILRGRRIAVWDATFNVWEKGGPPATPVV